MYTHTHTHTHKHTQKFNQLYDTERMLCLLELCCVHNWQRPDNLINRYTNRCRSLKIQNTGIGIDVHMNKTVLNCEAQIATSYMTEFKWCKLCVRACAKDFTGVRAPRLRMKTYACLSIYLRRAFIDVISRNIKMYQIRAELENLSKPRWTLDCHLIRRKPLWKFSSKNFRSRTSRANESDFALT